MNSNDIKAKDLKEQAIRKLKGFSFFQGGKQRQLEEAAELYEKAANMFKASKNWTAAGEAFCDAADCFFKAGSKHDAATQYINASNCYRKINIPEAIRTLSIAVEYYVDDGRFSMAAKHQKDVAELFEQEMQFKEAIQAYKQAADYYDGENSQAAAMSCHLKVAQFSAQNEDYKTAIEIYESVGKKSLENNLLKYSAKDYFFRAALCYLANEDDVGGNQAISKYEDWDPTFTSTREHGFLQEIVKSLESLDVDAFTQATYEYDKISKLDQWKTTILLRIKNHVSKNENKDEKEGGGGLA